MIKLFQRKIAVVLGNGGVGKTTMATALAIVAARNGLKTVLITVDPSARLGDLLGLEEGGVVTSIALNNGYSFDALFTDSKSGIDQFIQESLELDQQEQLFQNPVYHTLTTLIGGAQGLSAIYHLWHLLEQDYDLIIVDTPPRDQAWDFLNIPQKMNQFLATPVIRLLIRYHHLLKRKKRFKGEQTWLLRGLKRFVGGETLGEIATFLSGFLPVLKLLEERACEMKRMLSSDNTGYCIVSDIRVQRMNTVLRMIDRLKSAEKKLDLMVFNRSLNQFSPKLNDQDIAQKFPEHYKLYQSYHNRALKEFDQMSSLPLDLSKLIIPRLPEEPLTVEQLEALVNQYVSPQVRF